MPLLLIDLARALRGRYGVDEEAVRVLLDRGVAEGVALSGPTRTALGVAAAQGWRPGALWAAPG
ncbi:hypothetical protein [Streptomyces venetus]|uniref:hypothetical protein n=1 Tax=Streptomyces venetus TaxID=1701086 RepID=UPI003C30573F